MVLWITVVIGVLTLLSTITVIIVGIFSEDSQEMMRLMVFSILPVSLLGNAIFLATMILG